MPDEADYERNAMVEQAKHANRLAELRAKAEAQRRAGQTIHGALKAVGSAAKTTGDAVARAMVNPMSWQAEQWRRRAGNPEQLARDWQAVQQRQQGASLGPAFSEASAAEQRKAEDQQRTQLQWLGVRAVGGTATTLMNQFKLLPEAAAQITSKLQAPLLNHPEMRNAAQQVRGLQMIMGGKPVPVPSTPTNPWGHLITTDPKAAAGLGVLAGHQAPVTLPYADDFDTEIAGGGATSIMTSGAGGRADEGGQ